jgi:hypothetical protein
MQIIGGYWEVVRHFCAWESNPVGAQAEVSPDQDADMRFDITADAHFDVGDRNLR